MVSGPRTIMRSMLDLGERVPQSASRAGPRRSAKPAVMAATAA
jgi:hypothetical protein